MKQILLLLIGLTFLLMPEASQAQSSILDVETRLIKKSIRTDLSNAAYEADFTVNIRNRSPKKLQIQWDRVETQLPRGWNTQISDSNASYPPEVSSNYAPEIGMFAPVVLAPGMSFDLTLHIIPYGIPGEAVIDVPLSIMDDGNRIVETISYRVKVEDTERANYKRARPRVYPNPVQDSFYINNDELAQRVEVFNTLGRKVRTFDNIVPGQSYEVADLPEGVYLVSLVDGTGKRIYTLRLLKRNYRP